MSSPSNDGPTRGRTSRADDLARRERELERFRANIERLRREREASLAEFDALTRRTDEAPLPLREPAAPGVPADVADAFRPPDATAEADTLVSDLPVEDAPALEPPPDEAVDFAALAEEDTVIDAESRRAADRRRVLVVSLAGVAAVALVAVWLWGPRSHRRTDAPAPSSTSAGEPAPPAQDAASPAPAAPAESRTVQPVDAPAQAPAAGQPLVVRFVTSRPVWIRAVVDGRPSLNRLVPGGETLTLGADASVTVRIGDAGAVRVSVNGRDRGLAGRDGQVVNADFSTKDQ